jgi:hypothetical protein
VVLEWFITIICLLALVMVAVASSDAAADAKKKQFDNPIPHYHEAIHKAHNSNVLARKSKEISFKDVPQITLGERMTITPLAQPYKPPMPMVHSGKSTAIFTTLQQLQDDVDCKKLIEDAEAKAEAEWKEEMNAPLSH